MKLSNIKYKVKSKLYYKFSLFLTREETQDNFFPLVIKSMLYSCTWSLIRAKSYKLLNIEINDYTKKRNEKHSHLKRTALYVNARWKLYFHNFIYVLIQGTIKNTPKLCNRIIWEHRLIEDKIRDMFSSQLLYAVFLNKGTALVNR